MEDQVPFKVFTYWTDDSKPEVRRFGVEKTVVTSFHYLNAKLQDVYPGLKGRNYAVTWKDEDGDDIAVSSDEDMMTALTALQGNLIKLDIRVSGAPSDERDEPLCEIFISPMAENRNSEGPVDLTHYTVTCDVCNTRVVGFRYKCTTCYDYDLCGKCEAAGQHPEHVMLRLPSPQVPSALIKAAIKRSRHILKSVPTPDAHKRHRRDKSGERRDHARHERHERHERHRADYHCRRPRTSWLETFTSYMNEFANLAGDVDLPTRPQEDEKKDQPPQASADGAQARPEPSRPDSEPAPRTAEPTSVPVLPKIPGLENIPKLIELYLNGSLTSVLQNAASGSSASTAADEDASTSAAAAPSPAPASTSTPAPGTEYHDVDMDDGIQRSPEALNLTIKSEPSLSDDNVRDSSPDKVEGWTLINNEKDLLDSDKASAPAEAAPPFGFNLPQEFQERMNINEGQKLYPPLHAATAVMDPKEAPKPGPAAPTVLPVQGPKLPAFLANQPPQWPGGNDPRPQQPAAAPAPPRPRSEPQPQPRVRHPLAHIDAAIQQMLAMGFTNEDGWLTKLLESKDGNIAAVLDLLTPARN